MTIALLAAGALGSCVGARAAAGWVPDVRLKQLLGLLIVVMTACAPHQILSVA